VLTNDSHTPQEKRTALVWVIGVMRYTSSVRSLMVEFLYPVVSVRTRSCLGTTLGNGYVDGALQW